MNELLVATANRGKFLEIQQLLHNSVERIYSIAEFPDLPQVVEDGATFAENALKKARNAATITGLTAIADDSGLLVDALDGAPGVYSARFAGENATDADNNEKLLRKLAGISGPGRTAEFRSVIALCLPGGDCRTFTGQLKGIILEEPRGSGGFGYDPLFLVREFGQTMAELPLSVKNTISHRGMALNKLKEYLLNP